MKPYYTISFWVISAFLKLSQEAWDIKRQRLWAAFDASRSLKARQLLNPMREDLFL